MAIQKAMIFAAGLGTRLQPFTNHHPKALAMVGNKSLLQHSVEYLQKAGISRIIINVHHFAQQIKEAVQQYNGWGADISFSDETEALLETGGGLKKASCFFNNENFVVINADILTNFPLQEMMQFHNESNCLASLAVSNRTSSRYFLFDDKSNLCGWENTASQSKKIMVEGKQLYQKAFTGIHVIHTDIFKYITQTGKFSMVDVYLELCAKHRIMGYENNDALFLDVGKPESLEKAQHLFGSIH